MILIKTPKTREEFKAYYELRYRVLRAPWGQPKDTEKDDFEPISEHFMAIDEASGKIIGVVKVFEKSSGVGWFSHLAVDPAYQRHGVGKKLIETVEEAAKERGFTVLGCMSRLNTTAYFEKRGFTIAGFPSQYFGTTQVVWMEKGLT